LTVVADAARDQRPRLAIAGLEADPNGDARDIWIPIALEELLARRLQRVPGLLVVPSIRVQQARREMSDPTVAPSPWVDVARGLGATHLLTGHCSGPDNAVVADLTLRRLANAGPTVERHAALPAGRLYDTLDAVTRWSLDQLEQPPLPEELARRLLAAPSPSYAAVEYYARGVAAARVDQMRAALRYATQAVDYDRRFRPGLALLAQLESQMGPTGRGSAMRRWMALSDYARLEEDPSDRMRAEIGLSLLLQADAAFDAACTRAETALTLACEQKEIYGQIAAVTALCDLYLLRPLPAEPDVTVEARRNFALESARRGAQWQEVLVAMLDALGDVIGGLPATSKLALIYERIDRPDDALAMHRRTLALADKINSRPHQATAWLYIGHWYRQHERWPEALDAVSRCLALAEDAAKPAVRMSLGGVYQAMELHEEALGQFEQAYEQISKTEDLSNQFACLREIAAIRMKLGRRDKAITALQDAIDIAHALELRDEPRLREQLEQWKKGGT
jgi:tetratricopeptide (TPR) repeat protein